MVCTAQGLRTLSLRQQLAHRVAERLVRGRVGVGVRGRVGVGVEVEVGVKVRLGGGLGVRVRVRVGVGVGRVEWAWPHLLPREGVLLPTCYLLLATCCSLLTTCYLLLTFCRERAYGERSGLASPRCSEPRLLWSWKKWTLTW